MINSTPEIIMEAKNNLRMETEKEEEGLHIQDSSTLPIQQIVLKSGDAFLISDISGDFLTASKEMGLFWHGARFLRSCNLLLHGHPLMMLSHSVAERGDTCRIDLSNETLSDQKAETIGQGEIHIGRQLELLADQLIETITVTSFHATPVDLSLQLSMGADFCDLFEMRGATRKQHGQMAQPQQTTDALVLGYRGCDDVERYTHVGFMPPIEQAEPGNVNWQLQLQRGEPVELRLVVQMSDTDTKTLMPNTSASQLGALREPTIESGDVHFNQLLQRGMHDLVMLSTQTPQGYYPYAGIPWFCCPFGRDGLIATQQFLPWFPEVARGTLAFLAAYQGSKVDAFTDEEPGKILHEFRTGEMANCHEIPFVPYYGTIDATPLFLITLEGYTRWTNDIAFLKELWPNALAAANWIIEYGDRDGDGFLEYGTFSAKGLGNQGWKDSNDAVSHSDGQLAKTPIALCEVQGYAYAAFRAMSYLARQLGEEGTAERWEQKANSMQERFLRDFWWEEEQTCYLALDGDKKPCAVVSSNPGHCLWSGILPKELAQAMTRRMMREDMHSGWGIRTLSTQEARYNPMSYHNGSVWPHDSAVVGAGFARYDGKREAGVLLEDLLQASRYYERARLPELYCGFPQRLGYGPTRYPVACSPQAWATGASYMLLNSLLGFQPDAEQQRLTLDRPTLPDWLPSLEISGLYVGQKHVHLRFIRTGEYTEVIIGKQNEADVRVL
ncbi:MAG TPA: glycogen debranching N-terminal domain-containing protein [Ktedonobacteraceae bacterium]|nr:glycogen debranching N-terminal domain-containing protein [Ktedonobacteraceae bacterium]